MAGPKTRLKQIIRAIGPLACCDTASAIGISRTALVAALQYRCLAAVLQEPACWGTGWARTESVGCRNRFASKPAPTVFGSCLGWWGRLDPGERPVSHRRSERVETGLFPAEAGPTVECISSGRTGFSLRWTQSVAGCIPTQSVGTIRKSVRLPTPVRQQAGSYSSASCLGCWDRLQPGSV